MNRVTKTLLSALVLLVGGAALAKFAYEERRREPDKLLAEREAQRIFRFSPNEVVKARLVAKGVTIEFEGAEETGWMIRSPVVVPADVEALGSAFAQMSGIMQTLVVKDGATDADLAEYGLDHPRTTLEVELGTGAKHVLLVGAENELQAAFYVTDGARKTVWLAPNVFHWALDRDLFAFRGKRVLNLTREEIAGLRVTKGGRLLYAIRREGDGFLVGNPTPSVRMDPVLLNRLMVILTRDMKADAVMTDALEADRPQELAAFGLEPPHMRLEVEGAGGQTFGVRLGVLGEPKDAHEPHEGHEEEPEPKVYAWLEGTRTVVEVYGGLPTDLDTTVEKIRDRTVSRFDAAQIRRVELLLMDGTRAELAFEAEGRWKFVKPDNHRIAKPWVMEELLRRFSNFRADEFHQDEVPDKKLKEWMLVPPERRVAFYDASGALLSDVRIGNVLEKDKLFIMNAASRQVNLVRAISLKVLPATLDDLEHTPGG